MDARGLTRWSILVAIQRRIDAKAVGFYEAVLALNALRSLFPGSVDVAATLCCATDVWIRSVAEHLRGIIEGCEFAPFSADDWMAVWLAQKPTELLTAQSSIEKLLASAFAGLGDRTNDTTCDCGRDAEEV